MLSEDQSTQDGVLQYHWLINEIGMDGFTANIIANYDDDVIGTDSENSYRGARAIFSDPNLDVENPFPGDNSDQVDDNTNLITFPILGENDFSGEYFAGDPNEIPDTFAALVYDNNSGDGLYTNPANYVEDTNGNGVIDVGETNRPTLIEEVSGGVVRIADNQTMTLNQNGVQFSRLIIPENGTLEVDGTNGHLLGQVSGSGTIRIVTDAPNTDAALPGGDYNTFFTSGSGGALEYTGTGDYDILTGGINEVRSLTLNGSGVKTFVETDITIFEDLNLNEGTVVFPEDQTLTVGGDFNLSGASAEMSINGIIEVEGNMNLTSGAISGGTGAEITLRGDLTRAGATVNMTGADAGQLNLLGSLRQNVTGDVSGANSFANIVVNNTASGDAVVVSGVLGVDEILTLTDGIVATSNTDFRGTEPFSIPNVVSFNANATFAGGSSSSFIDGVVCKEALAANTSFRFPVGDASTYAPVIINEDGIGGATWKARYIKANPQVDLNTQFGSLTAQTEVSDREYWVVQTNASQTATIGLVYGTQSNVVVPNETTIVALKDGDADGIDNDDQWSDIGRGGLSSGANASGGEITADIASTFSANFYTVAGQTEAALPVELLSFEGAEINGDILLTWVTASELNNDFFEVQHSLDGDNFEIVEIVDGNGTSNALIKYSFVHKGSVSGSNYYRLKQVDFDGNSEIHNSIIVHNSEIKLGMDAVIYPNPARRDTDVRIRIESNDGGTPVEIEVISLSGKVMLVEQIEVALYVDQRLKIENGLLLPGVYIVKIKQGTEVKLHRLIIH